MNRRGFLAGLGALIGGIAIEKAIPFNRVWSFPKNIVIASRVPHVLPGRIDALSLKHWFRIETHPIEYYEFAGQTLFPVSYLTQGEIINEIRQSA